VCLPLKPSRPILQRSSEFAVSQIANKAAGEFKSTYGPWNIQYSSVYVSGSILINIFDSTKFVFSFCIAPQCALLLSLLSNCVAYLDTIYISLHFRFTYLLKWNLKSVPGTRVMAIRCLVPKTGNAASHFF